MHALRIFLVDRLDDFLARMLNSRRTPLRPLRAIFQRWHKAAVRSSERLWDWEFCRSAAEIENLHKLEMGEWSGKEKLARLIERKHWRRATLAACRCSKESKERLLAALIDDGKAMEANLYARTILNRPLTETEQLTLLSKSFSIYPSPDTEKTWNRYSNYLAKNSNAPAS